MTIHKWKREGIVGKAENLVSVIIPTYNRRHILKKSIDSVLGQSYRNFEIIVVDDCSSDDTAEFLYKEYGNSLENDITYIRNDRNVGAGESRNIGLSYAKGEFIAFQDSDTEWSRDKLEKQVEYLISCDDSAAMVYSPYKRIYQNYSIIYPSLDIPIEEKSGYLLQELLKHPLVDTPTMLLRKSVLDEIGGFDPEMSALEDYELSIRIAQKYWIGIINEVLLLSYNEEDSISNDAVRYFHNSFYLLRKHRELFRKYDMVKDYLDQLSQYAIQVHQIGFYMQCLREYFALS